MNDPANKIPGSVPGVFYVMWDCDPHCDCYQSYPEFLAEEPECHRAFFHRQPANAEEFEICRELQKACPNQAVRGDGAPWPDLPETDLPLAPQLRLLIRRGAGPDTIAPLLAAGADPNLPDLQNQVPLHLTKRTDVVVALLESGANPNASGGPLKEPALVRFARFNHEAACYLLTHGAQTDVTGPTGTTALMASRFLELSQQLLEQGANVNRQNVWGKTALMYASRRPDTTELTALLLNRGANPTLQTNRNETALFFGVQSGNLEIVRQLVAHGVPLNVRDEHGTTALLVAQRTRATAIETFLRLAGAEL